MNIADSFSNVPAAAADRPASRRAVPLLLIGFTVASIIGLLVTLYLSLVYAGTDVTQGHIQRIFYIHVATFSGAAVAFAATVIGGVLYLRTRQIKWDTMALAGVEVGLVLSSITLLTGSIWARPIWNTWWTWDPRLTSAAIMVLTYAAYLMLRSGVENPQTRRMFASVYGILAVSTVIFTFVVIRIRPDTIHPTVIGPGQASAEGGFQMETNMTLAISVAAMVFCCLIAPTLMWWRIRLENMTQRVQRAKYDLLND
jgi:heme exporter protein C